MTIDSLSPSTLPDSGPVTLSGSVTNTTEEKWLAIDVYPVGRSSPITNRDEMSTALALDPALPVGERITTEGHFDTVGDLDPGESTTWQVTVPRSVLVPERTDGIYWVGAHALGETASGRVDGSDGTARTFIPQVPDDESIDVALVMPLRGGAAVTPDGRLARPGRLLSEVSPGGRLERAVGFGAAADTEPLTWLVDPALAAGVEQLAAGNETRSLEPVLPDLPDEEDEGEEVEPSEGATFAQADLSSLRQSPASRWLNATGEAIAGDEILNLPWGDLDVSAAAASAPEVYTQARKRSGATLMPWGYPAVPTVSSPNGYLSRQAIEAVPPDTVTLISDRMTARSPDPLISVGHSTVAVAASEAVAGGPGPDDPGAPVAVRQRLLSEAALRALAGEEAMIAVLPTSLPADAGADFFDGVDADFVQLRHVTEVLDGPAPKTDELLYPASQERAQLPAEVFADINGMVRRGGTLDRLLPETEGLSVRVSQDALLSGSFYSRHDPQLARTRANRGAGLLQAELDKVTLTVPTANTLASDTGKVSASVVNGLDQPIEVRVEGSAFDRAVQIKRSPVVRLEPGERATVLLDAKATSLGVHEVELAVITADGTPVGAKDTLPLRSGQVSDAIWVILAVGLGLLFGAVVVRGVRRAWGARKGVTT